MAVTRLSAANCVNAMEYVKSLKLSPASKF